MSSGSTFGEWSSPAMQWTQTVSRAAAEARRNDAVDLTQCDDAELVAIARAGDAAAFDVLVPLVS